MTRLPTGTVIFLFTDIEGSTRLLQILGEGYPQLLERHAVLIREALAQNGGIEVSTEGDAFFCVFPTAPQAVAAVVQAQRTLADQPWPGDVEVRVRMGLHTGLATVGGDNYVGLDVHRAARVASAGYGGQVLLSEATRPLAEQALPEGVGLKDLGTHRLKDLAQPERIHQLVISGLPSDFPPLRSLDVTPNNLPIQVTSFVGREALVGTVIDLLDHTTRLLTLTGPGGTGKTRLALQVASEALESFPDGVFFVALATITEPELVPSSIVNALDLPITSDQPFDRLVGYLEAKSMLLVLDNFEQVLEGAVHVAELLRQTEDLKVLVTSRAPLRISGEQEMPVPPLSVPSRESVRSPERLRQYEAVGLFAERARATRPDFSVTTDNAEAVAEITARLDGLPLAIELAAARVKILPPQAILERLDQSLSILSRGSRDLPTRQQTLHDAIAWSYDLLDESGCRLLERLSVFAGGTTFEEAEKVCAVSLEADVLDGLGMLVDQSLLRQEDVEGRPRFSMLETIREFAAEKLRERGDEVEIRDRHCAVYLALAEEAAPHLLSRDQKRWLDRLEDEVANLRAAAAWAAERGQTESALCFAAALWRFAQIRGYLHEGRTRTENFLRLPGGTSSSRARALEAAAGLAYWQADFEAALRHYQESLDLFRRLGDESGTANILYSVSLVLEQQDPPRRDEAEAALDEAEEIYQRLGDRAGQGRVLWARGTVRMWRQQFPEALELYRRALPVFREHGTPFDLGWALYTMASAALELHDVDTARPALEEGLELFAQVRDVSGVVLHLATFAKLSAMKGDIDRAIRLGGAMAALRKSSGTDLVTRATGAFTDFDKVLDEAGEAGLPLLAEGAAMSLEQAVQYAFGSEIEKKPS